MARRSPRNPLQIPKLELNPNTTLASLIKSGRVGVDRYGIHRVDAVFASMLKFARDRKRIDEMINKANRRVAIALGKARFIRAVRPWGEQWIKDLGVFEKKPVKRPISRRSRRK